MYECVVSVWVDLCVRLDVVGVVLVTCFLLWVSLSNTLELKAKRGSREALFYYTKTAWWRGSLEIGSCLVGIGSCLISRFSLGTFPRRI